MQSCEAWKGEILLRRRVASLSLEVMMCIDVGPYHEAKVTISRRREVEGALL